MIRVVIYDFIGLVIGLIGGLLLASVFSPSGDSSSLVIETSLVAICTIFSIIAATWIGAQMNKASISQNIADGRIYSGIKLIVCGLFLVMIFSLYVADSANYRNVFYFPQIGLGFVLFASIVLLINGWKTMTGAQPLRSFSIKKNFSQYVLISVGLLILLNILRFFGVFSF